MVRPEPSDTTSLAGSPESEAASYSTGYFGDWPVDDRGYEVQRLSLEFSASYALGHQVYLGHSDGRLGSVDDRDLTSEVCLGRPLDVAPRLVFASRSGVIFASATDRPLMRSADGGETWITCLEVPVWRMAEDDQGNLYAGDYLKVPEHTAEVYRSVDQGASWARVFAVPQTNHVHSIRWDDKQKLLYLSFGDALVRGEGVSSDRGEHFVILGEGQSHGYTDVALTSNFLFWATDDNKGRVYRVNRATGQSETLLGGRQYMWWEIASGQQLYVGTMPAQAGDCGALLASSDEGATWQKLIEAPQATGPYVSGVVGDSRELSADGWAYCSVDGEGFRVRRCQR